MHLVDRAIRFIAGAIVGLVVMAAVDTGAARAQQPQTPTVAAFLANPGQLLQQYPNGGALLISAVQQLALADPATFKVLLGLVASANDLQRGALGEGLTQAAKIEVLTDQTLAADWQQQIAAITDPTFKTAATNALGDVQLGAIGGGPLGGPLGGAGGGPTGGNNSGPPPNPPGNTNTPTFTFTSSTSGSSSPSFSVSP